MVIRRSAAKAAASPAFAISRPRAGSKASNPGSSIPAAGAAAPRWEASGSPDAGSTPETAASSAACLPARRSPSGERSVV